MFRIIIAAGLRITIVAAIVAATAGSVRVPQETLVSPGPDLAIGKPHSRGISHSHSMENALVHDVGLIQLELSEKSTFGGYYLPHDPPSGAGQWPGSTGQNYLAGGGLWVGTRTDSVDRVMHDYYWASPTGGDWAAVPGEGPAVGSEVSDQDLRVVYTDSAAPHPLGLQIVQTSRQWAAQGINEFIIFEYEILNISDRLLDRVFASFWLDPDLVLENNTFIYDDLVAWDAERNLVYAFDSGQTCHDPAMNPENILCPPGFIGLQVLTRPVIGKSVQGPYAASVWNPDRDPVRTIRDTDESFLELMTSGVKAVEFDSTSVVGDDYRMLVTAQPFSLHPGASVRLAFGMAIGGNLEALQAQTDAMTEVFEATPLPADHATAPETPAVGPYGVTSYPNPFVRTTTVQFEIDKPAAVRVTVYDILGREVTTLASGRFAPGLHRLTWQTDGVPGGTYFCRLEAHEGRSFSIPLVLAK